MEAAGLGARWALPSLPPLPRSRDPCSGVSWLLERREGSTYLPTCLRPAFPRASGVLPLERAGGREKGGRCFLRCRLSGWGLRGGGGRSAGVR